MTDSVAGFLVALWLAPALCSIFGITAAASAMTFVFAVAGTCLFRFISNKSTSKDV